MSTRLIYPARRAVEHAVTVAGVRPRRLFPVLWPLWQVETTATFYDEQPYDLVDRFLVRAVTEAELTRVDELVAFLGVPEAWARRCLRYLSVIGHIRLDGDLVRMTELGLSSARDGLRYVYQTESRQDILVERFTGRPLPRSHYAGSVEVLPSWTVDQGQLADRSRFRPLNAPAAFRRELVEQLVDRPDRTELNLPAQLRHLRVVEDRDGFLPAYVVETVDSGLLVYTAAAADRDAFFEAACREAPVVHSVIDAEEPGDPRQIWTEWLAGPKTIRRGTLRQLSSGIWRATLHEDSFGGASKLPLTRLGSFELRKHHFLQLWCQDAELRRRAAHERGLGLATTREVRTLVHLESRVAELAVQLEVRAPTVAELRAYGEQHGMHAHVARLDQLE